MKYSKKKYSKKKYSKMKYSKKKYSKKKYSKKKYSKKKYSKKKYSKNKYSKNKYSKKKKMRGGSDDSIPKTKVGPERLIELAKKKGVSEEALSGLGDPGSTEEEGKKWKQKYDDLVISKLNEQVSGSVGKKTTSGAYGIKTG